MSKLKIAFIIIIFSHNLYAEKIYEYADLAMSTILRIRIYAKSENIADKASDKAIQSIKKLSYDLGYRNKNSSIGKINFYAGIKSVPVTKVAYNIIKRSLYISENSGGIFDISIGAITTIPDYYKKNLVINKNLVNYNLISLCWFNNSVFLKKKNMKIDLSGIAKGAIIDHAVRILKENHIKKGTVEAGGDLFCFGDMKWKVGIQNPRDDSKLLGFINVKSKGICGSGDYYQFQLGADGNVKSHHIINPKKRKSSRKSISVTVISKSAELADGLATTLMILGPVKGKLFLSKNYSNSAALWVERDLSIVKTVSFPMVEKVVE